MLHSWLYDKQQYDNYHQIKISFVFLFLVLRTVKIVISNGLAKWALTFNGAFCLSR